MQFCHTKGADSSDITFAISGLTVIDLADGEQSNSHCTLQEKMNPSTEVKSANNTSLQSQKSMWYCGASSETVRQDAILGWEVKPAASGLMFWS
ncbi:hypothetical protein J6590_090706 [Homalodisca vitripennis]|nr:hypothetical protein J6590_090706 [Homalodisca vitripennis]